jgi:sigma-B regulation protein RsbU (phosphoserine phosphatase)
MKKRIAIAATLVVFAAFLSGCALNAAGPRTVLDAGWAWSLAPDDASSFRPISRSELSSLERLVPGESGEIWLENRFDVPQPLLGTDASCYLGRITMADRVWINGVFVGGEGVFDPDGFSEWNRTRLYRIPSNLLSEGGNTMLIRVRVDHEGSLPSVPFIGGHSDTAFAALSETFWNSTINLLIAAVMLVVGCYHLFLYAMRRKDFENLLFACINILTAIYLSNFFLGEIPGFPPAGWSFLAFQKIVANALPFPLAFMTGSFVRVFLGRSERRPIFAVRLALLAIPLAVIFLAPDYGSLRLMRGWTQLFLLPPIFYVLFMAFSSRRNRNEDAPALLWGLSPLAFFIVLDIVLHEVFKLYNLPYITSLGWQMVVLSLLFVLAHRFSIARTGIEVLNESLERKVDERTAELSDANARLSETNGELVAARARAERDMAMAAFVQRSFFLGRAPSVSGWDIAFEFVPMSGVSGDLYDFYTAGNELDGAALFDVSGHGIASGLVTMLARNVLFREFRGGKEAPLADVMARIDRALIAEKGTIENYLTGVLLRFSGNRVEYVNAGHPDALVRSGRNGIVQAVRIGERGPKGRMIGIEGLSDGFGAIGFTMNPADALLLYTDCLVESRNAEGAEFGSARLEASFSRSDGDSARSMLDGLLSDFRSFTEGVPLNDDLTVIVIRKTGK